MIQNSLSSFLSLDRMEMCRAGSPPPVISGRSCMRSRWSSDLILVSPFNAMFGRRSILLVLLLAISKISAENGINLSIISTSSASVASLGISSDFSTVDYRARTTTMNLIDYCSDPRCGACGLLPSRDPCQVNGPYCYMQACDMHFNQAIAKA